MSDVSVIFRLLAVDETAGGLESASAKFSETMKGIGEAFAIGELINFGSEALQAADAATRVFQQTQNIIAKTGDTIGVTATEVQELADKYGELDGVEGSLVQNSLNFVMNSSQVQAAMASGKVTADELTQTLLNVAAVQSHGAATADSLSTAASTLNKALQNPFTATKALASIGDSLTASQTKQLAAFKKTGDTADAYKLILDSVAQATQGAAAANTTPMQKLAATFEDLKVKVGTALMPAFTSIANALLKLTPQFVTLANDIGGFVNFLVAHGNVFGPMIQGGLLFVVALTSINRVLKATEALMAVFGSEATLALGPWGIALLAIGAAIVVLYNKFAWFHNAADKVIQGVRDILQDFVNVVVDVASAVASKFGWAWDKVVSLYNASGIPSLISGVKNFLSWLGSGSTDDALESMSLDATMGSVVAGLHTTLVGGSYDAGYASIGAIGDGMAAGVGSGGGAGGGGGAAKAVSAVQSLASKVADALASFKNKIVQSFGSMGSLISNAMSGPPGSNFLIGNLQAQLAKAKQFAADISTLRKYGLNATSLNELIAAGPDQGADAARQLATTGLGSIGQVNSLETQLNTLGNNFANQTAKDEFGTSAAAVNRNKVYLNLDLSGVSNDALVTALRKAIRVRGGSVQTVLGGAG